MVNHGKRHPSEMDKTEVEAFLSHLAVVVRVSSSGRKILKIGPPYFCC
ncbi:MAG: phage integrase N-terminal SAM-like domain-containing protein [Methylococcales bacterium]